MTGQNVKSNIFARRKILAELPGELPEAVFIFSKKIPLHF
jgi:hypothetical protein